MLRLTEYQKEEILSFIEIRKETIEDDPESADEFETPENLDALYKKINDNYTLTEPEKKWLVGECENRIEIAEANRSIEGNAVVGLIAAMRMAIYKITKSS